MSAIPATVLEPWLDKRGLATHLACSVRSIENAVAEGMPHAIIFGRVKFQVPEVEAWLADTGAGSPDEAVGIIRDAIKGTWIYAVQAGTAGPIKIGITTSPARRLKALQNANAERLHGLAAWQGSLEDEQRLHRRFAAARMQGEWFQPTPELVDYVVSQGDWETT